jgi:micrococcal nuclease
MPIDLPPAIVCEAPRAIDGDTIRCANLPKSVRLIGIDAPELPGHCRKGRTCTPGDGFVARRALAQLLRRAPVTIHPTGHDRYGRILARVIAGRLDLNCAMLAGGHAVRRYSALPCA